MSASTDDPSFQHDPPPIIKDHTMATVFHRRSVTIALAACAVLPPLARASDADEARRVVDRARIAFDDVVKTPDHETLRAGLKSAKGVLVFPSILKGGFVIGGSGGTGVLLVREGEVWSQPAFYTLGAVSVGLLAGGQSAEVVILVNSQKGVDRLLTNSLKLGGEASIAAGPVGAGKAANLTADFVSYAKSKGAYLGASVEGSVLDVRDTLNHAYYGKAVSPLDILVKRTVSNPHAQALRAALASASR
jgi:SH3 domain-containing YSC84-like protein 1